MCGYYLLLLSLHALYNSCRYFLHQEIKWEATDLPRTKFLIQQSFTYTAVPFAVAMEGCLIEAEDDMKGQCKGLQTIVFTILGKHSERPKNLYSILTF